MTTAAPEAPVAQLSDRQLPLFEGHRIRTARVGFGGAWEFPLTNDDDVAFAEALKLGREMTIVIAVDGHEREITLGGRVTKRAHRFRKEEGDESTVTDYRVTINHQQVEDEGTGE